ncbi:DUF6483 family protein [Paenibacillus sp. J2TS4]|uniref:DUF6483 family protein n=1 Tax=Paenibacillus sp. J2TS4 TaxID=2807194 RepID=UPI001B02820C|nr:DUF6483 family protein [Paenibacillus sp. J2TS4]GIP32694.1 hypothetical protein J2TS4_19040 [Paenibacillus sp. J2TS4]
MYHRDYLMRLIGQMTQMLGRLAGLRKEQKADQAEAIMEEWLGRSLGISLKLIRALSYQDLIKLLTSGNGVDTDKLLIVARLVREDGELTESVQGRDAAYPMYVKSLMLLFAARGLGITQTDYMDLVAETDGLLDKLAPYSLEKDCLHEICRYCLQMERYSDAEDWLFEWIGQDAHGEAIQFGHKMYERLLQLSDAELQQGRLPREEIREAQQELKALEEQQPAEGRRSSGAEASGLSQIDHGERNRD